MARPSRAGRVSGRVVIPTVSTVRRGGRAAICHRAKVTIFGARGVGAAVFRLTMVKGADRADRVIVFADGGRVAIPLTVAASSSFIGGVGGLDLPLATEKEDVGAHSLTILRAGCDNDRGGKLQRAGFRIRVEKAGRGNLNTFRIEYGSFEVHEETFIGLWEIAKGEAMDGKLVFIGGRPEREPREEADREGFVQACRQGTKEGSVIGGRRGGRDPQEGDRTI